MAKETRYLVTSTITGAIIGGSNNRDRAYDLAEQTDGIVCRRTPDGVLQEV